MNTDSDQIGKDVEEDAFNIVLDVLRRCDTRGKMMAEAEAKHAGMKDADNSEDELEAEQAQQFAEDNGFANIEAWELYQDGLLAWLQEKAANDASISELDAIFAEDYFDELEREKAENNDNEEDVDGRGIAAEGDGVAGQPEQGAVEGGDAQGGTVVENAGAATGELSGSTNAENGAGQGASAESDGLLPVGEKAGGGAVDSESNFIAQLQELLDSYESGDGVGLTERDVIGQARSYMDELPDDSELAKRLADAFADYDDMQEAYRYENGQRDDDGTDAMMDVLRDVAGEKLSSETVQEEIAAAEAETDTNPTDAQKEAGNYKKGHVKIDGYDITIENPKGSERSGVDGNGKRWSQIMNNTYGYIRGTEGVDGDHIDVFLSDNPTEGDVFVIDQVNPSTGEFDEHKVMYGFPNAESAREAYLSNYNEGWKGLGTITHVSKEEFKKWINSSHRKTKAFAEYKSVKEEGAQGAAKGDEAVREEELQPIGTGAFGPIYDQFRGKAQEAIAFLKEKKEGEAVGALSHKAVGEIDLVWGEEGTGKSDGFGLAKLVKYHPEVLEDLQGILDDMEVVKRSANRVQLESDTHKATIRLEWDNKKKTWLLTAFEKKNSASDNTTDTDETAESGKQNDTATLQNTVSEGKGSENVSTDQEKEGKNDLLAEWKKEPVGSSRREIADLTEEYSRLTDESNKAWRKWLAGDTKSDEGRNRRSEWNNSLYESAKVFSHLEQMIGELADEEGGKDALKELEDYGQKTGNARLLSAIESAERNIASRKSNGELFDERINEQGDLRPKAYKGKVKIEDFADNKNEQREVMHGVYHDPEGYAIASNGMVLIADKSSFDKEQSGKIIAANKVGDKQKGDVIEGEYPNWRNLRPAKDVGHAEAVDWQAVQGNIEAARDLLKQRYDSRERKGSFKKFWEDADVYLRMPDGSIMFTNLSRFEKFVWAAQRVGSKELRWQDPSRAMSAEGELGIALNMPKLYDGVPRTEDERVVYIDLSPRVQESESSKGAEAEKPVAEETALDMFAEQPEENTKEPEPLATEEKPTAEAEAAGRNGAMEARNKPTRRSLAAQEKVDEETGNVALFHKAEGKPQPLTAAEKVMGEALDDVMRKAGIPVSTDWEKSQNVLDAYKEKAKLMGTKKSASETAAAQPSEGGQANATDVSSADGAKVIKKVEELAKLYAEKSNRPYTFLADVGTAIGANTHGSNSRYTTIKAKNGKVVTIRLAGHNATVRNFDNHGERAGVSIVVSKYPNEGINDNGSAHVVEFFYPEKDLRKSDGKPLVDIIRSIEQMLYSGEYKDTTGLAEREEVNADVLNEMRSFGGNSGYVGYSMSRRAAEARKEGRYPKTDFKKEYKLSDVTLEALLAADVVDNSEWHHTSMYGNRTPFYGWSEKWMPAAYASHKNEIDALAKEKAEGYVDKIAEILDGSNEHHEALREEAENRKIQQELSAYHEYVNSLPVEAEYDMGDGVVVKTNGSRYEGQWEAYKDGVRLTKKKGTGTRNRAFAELRERIKPLSFEEWGGMKLFRTENGEVYGFTLNGEIHIDPRIASSETRVHEYAHLWAKALRKANPAAWEQLKNEMSKDKALLDYVKGRYPEIEDVDDLMEEVFAHYGGKRGRERLNEEMREEINKADGVFEKAQAASIFARLRRLLGKFWNMARDLFAGKVKGVEKLRGEDFADMMMNDMLRGFDPRRAQEGKKQKKSGDKLLREVEDEALIRQLDNEPKIKAYRSMQLINGKLYPPMSAVVDGELREPTELGVWEEAEERPDLADERGYFKLNKGNKKSLKARYNPYIHSSRTMLNDQFSEAQNRDNLVVVEVEIPESELMSGYKAEKAKDSVGAKQWKAGVIQGQLSGTREVILSRWAKPVRIVPTEEVADNIYEQIKDQIDVMPSNVVTPQVRQALEARGVKFVETDNTGKIVGGENAGKSWTSVYGKGKNTLEDVNRKFNEVLGTLTEDNADKIILSLGRPSEALIAGGVKDKPMKLYGNKVLSKMRKHGFSLGELKNLPQAVAEPIAVFDNIGRKGNRSVLTELKTAQGSILVTLDLGADQDVDFNIVSSVFGKNGNSIVDWLNKGYATYIDKEKAHAFLSYQSALIAATAAKAELSDTNLKLESAAKVVKDFENPSISDGKKSNTMFREGDFDYEPYVSTRKLGARERRQNDSYAKRQARRARDIAAETVEKLGLQNIVTIYNNIDEVPNSENLSERERRARGWYDRKTGKTGIVLGNHLHVQTLPQDVLESVLHEAVAHYGLRRLFGKNFDTFLDNVYAAATPEIRAEIDSLRSSKSLRGLRDATEEYLARLAEDTDFERAQKSGWLHAIKMAFFDMLHKLGLRGFSGYEISDNELRYILWRSYKNLESPGEFRNRFGGVLEVAQDVSMQNKLKVGDFKDRGQLGMVAEYGMERSLFDEVDDSDYSIFSDYSDAELLERIGNTQGMEQALLSDEYDRRHRLEYEKEGNRYWQMLADDNTSFDDAAGMYANVYGRWANGGYASAERTKLQAQLDALREWAEEKEAEEEDGKLLREGGMSVDQVKQYLSLGIGRRYKINANDFSVLDSGSVSVEELSRLTGMDVSDENDLAELRAALEDKNVPGFYAPSSGRIIIFADRIEDRYDLEDVVFHEWYHLYDDKVDGRLTDFFWEHRDAFPKSLEGLKKYYKEHEWKKELAAYRMQAILSRGNWKKADEIFKSDADKQLLNEILNSIGYDRAREEANRRRVWDGRRVRAFSEVREKGLADAEEISSSDDQAQGRRRLSLSRDDVSLDEEGGAREEYERALAKTGFRLQEAWQDSMLGLKKLQEAIEKESVLEGQLMFQKMEGAESRYDNALDNERLDEYMPAVERANNYVDVVMRKRYKLPDADEMWIAGADATEESIAGFLGVTGEKEKKDLAEAMENPLTVGITSYSSGKIIIFADKLETIGDLRRGVLHETEHRYSVLEGGKLADAIWEHKDEFSDKLSYVEKYYNEEERAEELAAYVLEEAAATGDYSKIEEVLTSDAEREELNKYRNYISYDTRRTTGEGQLDGGRNRGKQGFARQVSKKGSSSDDKDRPEDDGGNGEGEREGVKAPRIPQPEDGEDITSDEFQAKIDEWRKNFERERNSEYAKTDLTDNKQHPIILQNKQDLSLTSLVSVCVSG